MRLTIENYQLKYSNLISEFCVRKDVHSLIDVIQVDLFKRYWLDKEHLRQAWRGSFYEFYVLHLLPGIMWSSVEGQRSKLNIYGFPTLDQSSINTLLTVNPSSFLTCSVKKQILQTNCNLSLSTSNVKRRIVRVIWSIICQKPSITMVYPKNRTSGLSVTTVQVTRSDGLGTRREARREAELPFILPKSQCSPLQPLCSRASPPASTNFLQDLARPSSTSTTTTTTLATPQTTDDFAAKLHFILDQVEYHTICQWRPHGRAFRIFMPRVFASRILPKYFGHSNLTRFRTDLQSYGFEKVKAGPEKNGAYLKTRSGRFNHYC